MNKVKNAVIYGRIATTKQQQSGNSLNDQVDRCKSFAEKNGYSVSAEPFIETGTSGSTTDREQLKKMLDYCNNKENGISAVICHKVDRLTRNAADYASITETLAKNDIDVLFADSTEQK